MHMYTTGTQYHRVYERHLLCIIRQHRAKVMKSDRQLEMHIHIYYNDSMEIGSAYALQVCLLQIPAMVAFSLWFNWGKEELANYTFRYGRIRRYGDT